MNPTTHSDKRRRARVQGGWAQPRAQPTVPNPKLNVRSDAVRAEVKQPPAWLAHNVDPPPKSKPPVLVYEQPLEELKVAPPAKNIEQSGVHELSITTNGLSRVKLFKDFIDAENCTRLYDELFHSMPWSQRSDVKQGESFLQPRLTAWFGDMSYSYSGLTLEPSAKWPPVLYELLDLLEENVGIRFNSMLANLYRDGHDSLGWHSDDEEALGTHPTIASLTFGDTRVFEMRQKPPLGEDPSDFTQSQHYRIPLDNGTLLIMEGATQLDWQHRIPREYHDRGPRINLTFRTTKQV